MSVRLCPDLQRRRLLGAGRAFPETCHSAGTCEFTTCTRRRPRATIQPPMLLASAPHRCFALSWPALRYELNHEATVMEHRAGRARVYKALTTIILAKGRMQFAGGIDRLVYIRDVYHPRFPFLFSIQLRSGFPCKLSPRFEQIVTVLFCVFIHMRAVHPSTALPCGVCCRSHYSCSQLQNQYSSAAFVDVMGTLLAFVIRPRTRLTILSVYLVPYAST